jgi:hypothetical protein
MKNNILNKLLSIIIILIILFIIFCTKINKKENLVTQYKTSTFDGLGEDNNPEYDGPYDYNQDPNPAFAGSGVDGLGEDLDYSYDSPYNANQNPL